MALASHPPPAPRKHRRRAVVSDDETSDAEPPAAQKRLRFGVTYRDPADLNGIINFDNADSFTSHEMSALVRVTTAPILETIRRLSLVLKCYYVHARNNNGHYFIVHNATSLASLYRLATSLDRILGADGKRTVLVHTSHEHRVASYYTTPHEFICMEASAAISRTGPNTIAPGPRTTFISKRVFDHGYL